MPADSITIIFSPYHVGLRDHRVGDGPNRIRQLGLENAISNLGVQISFHEIPPVDDYEGEIGRSFEILSRTSLAVSEAVSKNSFPLILSGNCMASVGAACGLHNIDNLGFVYFDAHDDMATPSTIMNGYFDAMGLPILAGQTYHKIARTIPGFRARKYDKFLFCGIRDIREQKKTVAEAGVDAIWGDSNTPVDFVGELKHSLEKKDYGPALVHLDLDVLDESVGKVNGFESPGGLSSDELVECMRLVPQKAAPTALTVCSFNPNLGDGDKIAKIAVDAVEAFVKSLLEMGYLLRQT